MDLFHHYPSSSSTRHSRHHSPSPNPNGTGGGNPSAPPSASNHGPSHGPHHIPRPAVTQMYNLFHATDPLACRVEPLLSARFSRVPPINVPRYQKYPMGDGASLSLIEFIQANPGLFSAAEAATSRPNTPGTVAISG